MATSISVDDESIQQLVQTIKTNIEKILQNVNHMRDLVEQIDTLNDTNELREQLLQAENYTNQLAKDASQRLKDLNNYLKSVNDRILKAEKERLTNDLMTTLNKFQDLQKFNMKKQRDANEKAKQKVGYKKSAYDATESQIYSVRKSYSVENPNAGSSETMQKSVELDLVQIEDRDNQLKKLEHDINDVNLIFKDLALMVHDQGTFIDSIEANIVRVEVDVRQATTNLQNALDNQRKARTKKVVIFSIMSFILLVIVAVIVLSIVPLTRSS